MEKEKQVKSKMIIAMYNHTAFSIAGIIVAVVFVIIVLVVSLLPLTLIVCKKWVKNIKQW